MGTQAGLPLADAGVAAAPVHDPGARPSLAPSWVDGLLQAADRAPGPAWIVYLVALGPSLLFTALPYWVSGEPVGPPPPMQALFAFVLVGAAWTIHYLSGVAGDALAEFAPLLRLDATAQARLRHELVRIPAGPALGLLLFSCFRTTMAYAFQAEAEGVAGMSLLGMAIRWPFETLMFGLVLALLYQAVRQLRLVSRIHGEAPDINLFRPGPLYAFSRLTSRTAIAIALLVIPFGVNFTAAGSAFDVFMAVTPLIAILVVSVTAFVWPLVGMHRRMAAEKERLQMEVGTRLEVVTTRLHAGIDRDDLAGADATNKTLASLIAERDLLGRFSTWPWQAGTMGAVASAVLLPIGLWLVTRLMERVL